MGEVRGTQAPRGCRGVRVGWLIDQPNYIGGAELTAKAFRDAAPDGVEIVDIPTGAYSREELDRVVCHNLVSYKAGELGFDAPTFWYHHDVAPHITRDKWTALKDAVHICCSPLQRHKMRLDEALLIPPAVDLEPFRKAAETAGERSGAVAVGPWMNPGKNPQGALDWAKGNGGISFLGAGVYAPAESVSVDYAEMPEVLTRFKTFVHLPSALEPFGRSTAEAWAAGLEVVVNALVGARYWITEQPDKLETAGEDFWQLVLDA